MGYLAKADAGDKLRLAPPALSLGYVALTDIPISELALPYMQSLAARFHGGVSLGERDGVNIVYIQRCQGASIIFSNFRVGSRVPMLLSAAGWAYLAGLPESERAELLADLKKADPESFAKLQGPLHTAIANYEQDGYLTSIGMMHPELNTVALPIRSSRNNRLYTISCGGIANVFTTEVLKEIGPELADLVHELSLV